MSAVCKSTSRWSGKLPGETGSCLRDLPAIQFDGLPRRRRSRRGRRELFTARYLVATYGKPATCQVLGSRHSDTEPNRLTCLIHRVLRTRVLRGLINPKNERRPRGLRWRKASSLTGILDGRHTPKLSGTSLLFVHPVHRAGCFAFWLFEVWVPRLGSTVCSSRWLGPPDDRPGFEFAVTLSAGKKGKSNIHPHDSCG